MIIRNMGERQLSVNASQAHANGNIFTVRSQSSAALDSPIHDQIS